MAKLVHKTVIGIKQETTQGTPAAVGATDFILASDVELEGDFELVERDYYRSSLDPVVASIGKRKFKISFKTELKGGGAAGTAYAPLGAAIQACAFTETVNAGTSVVYTPTSAPASSNYYGPGKSVSIEVYKDGIKHVAAGCIGNMKLTFPAGKIAVCSFEFQGLYAEPTDADPGTQTYLGVNPAIVQSATFSIHSFSAVIEQLEIDCGNEVIERPSVNAATSLLGFMIASRKPSATINPETDTVANHNIFNRITAGTAGAMAITLGATAGNIVALAFDNAQYTGVKYANRNGILIWQPGIRLTGDGDNFMIITMT